MSNRTDVQPYGRRGNKHERRRLALVTGECQRSGPDGTGAAATSRRTRPADPGRRWHAWIVGPQTGRGGRQAHLAGPLAAAGARVEDCGATEEAAGGRAPVGR